MQTKPIHNNSVYKITIGAIFLIHLTHVVNPQFFSMDYNENMFRTKHTLIQPYLEPKSPFVEYWDNIGATTNFDHHIRLTPDTKSQQGGLWNNVRNDMRYWQIQLRFKIHGKVCINCGGDGFVFWYTKDRMNPGPVFGSKDYFSGLAVIVDTYNNHDPSQTDHEHEHPYISVMVSNGSLKYDHDNDGHDQRVAGCSAKLRNVQHNTAINIRYDNDELAIFTDVTGKGYWENCIWVKGVRLPTGYYFGLSAATGDLSDNHDILSVQTYEIERDLGVHRIHGSMDNIVPFAPMYQGHALEEGAGWATIKIILILFAVLVLAAFAYGLVSISGTKTKNK